MFQLIRWSFNNLHVPMIQGPNDVLFCTSKQLCEALAIQHDTLRKLKQAHKDEFDSLSVTFPHAKDFLRQHKIELGIKRIKSDLTLWTENEMILVAILSKSGASKSFRKELMAFVKSNAITGYVTKDEHNRVLMELGRTCVRLDNLERIAGLKNDPKRVELRVVQG